MLERLRARRWQKLIGAFQCEHGRLAAPDRLDGGIWHLDDSSPCDQFARWQVERYRE